jgi:hypothetical protein
MAWAAKVVVLVNDFVGAVVSGTGQNLAARLGV